MKREAKGAGTCTKMWEIDEEGYALNPSTGKRFAYGDFWQGRFFRGWKRVGGCTPLFLSKEAFEKGDFRKCLYRKGSTRALSFVANQLFRSANKRAKKRKLPFSLTTEWVHRNLQDALIRREVVIASKGTGERSARAASIDRIVPHLGYEESNCRIVPIQLNCAKGEWDEDSFLEVVGAEVDRLRAQRALCTQTE